MGAWSVTHKPEITATKLAVALIKRSAAAERMRRHRERRSLGLRCLTIQLLETEIAALIRKGLLNVETRNDPNAVRGALYDFFDRTLDATS
jgi:hypothetical protein